MSELTNINQRREFGPKISFGERWLISVGKIFATKNSR